MGKLVDCKWYYSFLGRKMKLALRRPKLPAVRLSGYRLEAGHGCHIAPSSRIMARGQNSQRNDFDKMRSAGTLSMLASQGSAGATNRRRGDRGASQPPSRAAHTPVSKPTRPVDRASNGMAGSASHSAAEGVSCRQRATLPPPAAARLTQAGQVRWKELIELDDYWMTAWPCFSSSALSALA